MISAIKDLFKSKGGSVPRPLGLDAHPFRFETLYSIKDPLLKDYEYCKKNNILYLYEGHPEIPKETVILHGSVKDGFIVEIIEVL